MKATAAKMETAAERYRRIKAERAANDELFEVETPSGMVWKLRRLNLEQFVVSGTMPMQFATLLAKAQEEAGGDAKKAFATLDISDKLKALNFSQKVVRYCAVEPRIVEMPQAADEIGFDEVEIDDFNAILSWAMPNGDITQGGGEAESLEPFPAK